MPCFWSPVQGCVSLIFAWPEMPWAAKHAAGQFRPSKQISAAATQLLLTHPQCLRLIQCCITLTKGIAQAFGEVVSCRVLRFRDGTSKHVGFVCMSTHEEAALCVEHLHGAQVTPCSLPHHETLLASKMSACTSGPQTEAG